MSKVLVNIKKGATKAVTTSAGQITGLRPSGTYAISNLDATGILFINNSGVTAVATTDLPVFPNETIYVRAPQGTINVIGSASLAATINEVVII